MKQNSQRKKTKKNIIIKRIFIVLFVISFIFVIIKIIKDVKIKNGEYIEDSAVFYENTISGDLQYNQDNVKSINITNIKYIYFEKSERTALNIYIENTSEDIKSKNILVNIKDGNDNEIKSKNIEINTLKKGQSTKINISVEGKLDESFKVEIQE